MSHAVDVVIGDGVAERPSNLTSKARKSAGLPSARKAATIGLSLAQARS